MRRRDLAGVVFGAAVATAGLLVVVAPGLFAGFSASYPAVLLVGVVAALLGVSTLTDRFDEGKEADLPEVEGRTTVPAPGDDFDERLAALPARYTRGSKPDRTRVRQRLEAAAVAAQVRAGVPVDLAERRLVTGRWTDDRAAAEFFRRGANEGASRAGRLLGRESPFARRARAAARAVAAIVETGEVPDVTEEERAWLDRERVVVEGEVVPA